MLLSFAAARPWKRQRLSGSLLALSFVFLSLVLLLLLLCFGHAQALEGVGDAEAVRGAVEELFDVISCYFPISFVPVSHTPP